MKWKQIPNFPKYFANKLGEIKGSHGILNSKRGGHKYSRVCLSPDFKDRYVHRLILLTFVGQPSAGLECAHLNGDTKDNRLKNLKWVTRTENHSHKHKHKTILLGSKHQNAKLTEAMVKEIRSLYRPSTFGYIRLARLYKVNHNTVRSIIKRKTWIHI